MPALQLLESLIIDSPEVFGACLTVTAGPGFHVLAGGDAALRAGQSVALTDDSSVAAGASLSMEIDPLPMP